MAYASKAGRAIANARNPRAQAVCDRCGMWYQRQNLVFQRDWRGTNLQNLYILVCTRTCLDVPQSQLRSIVIPPDPVPIYQPRVENFRDDET